MGSEIDKKTGTFPLRGVFPNPKKTLMPGLYGKVIILGLIVAFLQLRPTGIFPARGRSED